MYILHWAIATTFLCTTPNAPLSAIRSPSTLSARPMNQAAG